MKTVDQVKAPPLVELVAGELSLPVEPAVTAMAIGIAARHPGARAVLFYGSCLRETRLDGLMLDFYLIVEDYGRAFGKGWLALANRLLPPNVFPFEQCGLIAKYAVLSEGDFARLMRPEADNVSLWARFAQPSRLVWSADEDAAERAAQAIEQAAPTLFQLTLPMMAGPAPSILDVWRQGFALTYGAELRAERANRPGSVVDADPERYERFGAAVPTIAGQPDAPAMSRRWRQLRRHGKALTLARLAKASATYAGGIDYLAWKIGRHSGQPIAIRPWQRRWPILGALTLLPKLLAKGAVR